MRKTAEFEQARALRGEGRSVKEIARLVGVSVSSVSGSVRDVPITHEQRLALLRRMTCNGRSAAAIGRSKAAREVRRTYQERGRVLADEARPMHIAGCMLYWAEGSKSRNAVQFVNSDPAMVRYFVDFLRREYAISDDRFTVACNLFADHLSRQREVEQFWLDTLGLPTSCLRKSTVNVFPSTARRRDATDCRTGPFASVSIPRPSSRASTERFSNTVASSVLNGLTDRRSQRPDAEKCW
jgi:hypothetical protein